MPSTRDRRTYRRCGHCKTDKPLSEFSRSRNKSAWCRSCCAENARKWRAANLERARDYEQSRKGRYTSGRGKEWMRFYRWLTRHGLRPEDYGAMFDAQDGRCAICRAEPAEGEFLHIDHDHVTGRVRGLLCMPCNTGLGFFRDDTERMRAAIAYLGQNGALSEG